MSATKDTLRRAGSHVAGIAPYGFTTKRRTNGKLSVIRLVPDPVEAQYVRDMAKWAADGMSAAQIAKRLNEDAVPTKAASLGESGVKRLAARRARGTSEAVERPSWVSSTVLRVLRDPRLAGYAIEWQGRVQATRDADGQEATDNVTAGRVWARLMAMTPDDPEGLEWLAEASRRFAHQGETSQREAERTAVRAELEHIRESRRILHADRLAGVYDDTTGTQMFQESMARLSAHEQRTAERLAQLDSAEVQSIHIPHEWTSPNGDPIGEGSTWASWDLKRKREFLALFIDTVRITKSVGRGRNANTLDRVIIKWAESPEGEAL
ncbi:recombinase family protein [Streptomyces sp. NPDC088124]|uniref:recombinase family protein n=1 Tax=Streptomyces sp. NPDC088124 TaxID=3154654 RepID=UPI003419415C